MSVFAGTNITDMYVGGNKIAQGYVGNTLIYDSGGGWDNIAMPCYIGISEMRGLSGNAYRFITQSGNNFSYALNYSSGSSASGVTSIANVGGNYNFYSGGWLSTPSTSFSSKKYINFNMNGSQLLSMETLQTKQSLSDFSALTFNFNENETCNVVRQCSSITPGSNGGFVLCVPSIGYQPYLFVCVTRNFISGSDDDDSNYFTFTSINNVDEKTSSGKFADDNYNDVVIPISSGAYKAISGEFYKGTFYDDVLTIGNTIIPPSDMSTITEVTVNTDENILFKTAHSGTATQGTKYLILYKLK